MTSARNNPKRLDRKVVSAAGWLLVAASATLLLFLVAPGYAHHALLAIAAVLCSVGAGALLRYRSQDAWVRTQARLTRIEERAEEVPYSGGVRVTHYYPVAEYEYEMNGVRYTGTVVSHEKENVWVPEVDGWGDTTPASRRWWRSCDAGALLPVYVNPHDHRDAVLVKGASRRRGEHHRALLLSGALVALVWLVVVYLQSGPGG